MVAWWHQKTVSLGTIRQCRLVSRVAQLFWCHRCQVFWCHVCFQTLVFSLETLVFSLLLSLCKSRGTRPSARVSCSCVVLVCLARVSCP